MANSSRVSSAIPLSNVQSHNGSSSAPSTPATPYPQPQLRFAQTQTYSSMFDRAANARRQAGSEAYDFYTDEDVLNHSPPGWPSLVATKMYYPNNDSYRAFGHSTRVVLASYEQKLDCIANKLDEMNFEDSKAAEKPLKLLPFDREQFLGRCLQGTGHLPTPPPEGDTSKLDRATQRDNLIICAGNILKDYSTFLFQLYDSKKFARVSRRAQERQFEFARDFLRLSDEALASMRYVDDFIYANPDYIFQRFEYLLYTKARWVTDLLKHLCCLFCGDTLPASSEPDDPRVAYSLRPFELLFKAFLAVGTLAHLIIPVSLLYLGTGWSRVVKLVIVIVSSTVFAFAFAFFEPRISHLLVGLCAFFAVLVTFLSNLPGSDAT
ncbi:hypothetical protein F5Y05DRAFT_353544 [Hypoxylon sp. FL0543]|nr:hypothetical protein F5Y05DRAFT_353544 [Hypoxylon sp. FL0543]